MSFGTLLVHEAEGALLAHTIRLADGVLQNGHRLQRADIVWLREALIVSVVAARLEEGDLPENEAAKRMAKAAASDHLRFSEAATGRVNVHAAADGLFIAGRRTVDRLNRIDPAITFGLPGRSCIGGRRRYGRDLEDNSRFGTTPVMRGAARPLRRVALL